MNAINLNSLINLFFSEKENYMTSLGQSIVKVAKSVPDGLLIFFTTYRLMQKYQKFWESNGIWDDIERQKPIFTEPKGKKELKSVMLQYYTSVNENLGAIFMAVLKGKVSEGLDFADMYGRGVIVVGIPCAPYKTPKVVLKKGCLDGNRTVKNKLPTGEEWYYLEAVRAVNQAIGRVIRHKDDYGMILLMDQRFHEYKYNNDISSWIKFSLIDKSSKSFDDAIKNIEGFFARFSMVIISFSIYSFNFFEEIC